MNLREVLDSLNKGKRRQEKVKVAQQTAIALGAVAVAGVATGMLFAPKSGKETRKELHDKAISAAEIIKDAVQKKAEMVKSSAARATEEVLSVIHPKTVGEKITEDISKATENTSAQINKSVK